MPTKIYTMNDLGRLVGDGEFELERDIIITGKWKPQMFPFGGTLNGKGHKIVGLTDALFERIEGKTKSGAHIKDIEFERVAIGDMTRGDSAAIYGAVARLATNATFEKVMVSGRIYGGAIVGGLVGEARITNFILCVNHATVVGGFANNANSGGFVGGLAGIAARGITSNCVNRAKVCFRDDIAAVGSSGCGGLHGLCDAHAVRSSWNEGKVIGGTKCEHVDDIGYSINMNETFELGDDAQGGDNAKLKFVDSLLKVARGKQKETTLMMTTPLCE